MVCVCKRLPAMGQRQLLMHRVAPRVYNPKLTAHGKAGCGVYYAWLACDRVSPEAVQKSKPRTFSET